MGSKVVGSKNFRLHHFPASKKQNKPTVVFIHHMGGNHRTPARHVRLFNRWGYDCVTFDLLLGTNLKNLYLHPLIRKLPHGVFEIWYEQIIHVLSEVPGTKIVFSFSGPSLAALRACHSRQDVQHMICDGGPFEDIYKNTRHFFEHEMNVRQNALNKVAAFVGSALWGYRPLDKLHGALDAWNSRIPILSIRGEADPIVAIESIRKVFAPHPHLPLEVHEISKGAHLNGLRDFGIEYEAALAQFLKK